MSDATSFVRARSAAHKEQRRQSLVVAARAMLEEGTPIARLSLNELARRAGMTKSNTYRYFESREHVLLELLEEEWAALLAAVLATPSPTPATLTTTLARELAARPLLCELTTALPAVLEQNLTVDAVIAFKEKAFALFHEGGVALAARAPFLDAVAAARLLGDIAILIGGLWPYNQPAPAVTEALARAPHLCALQKDFAKDLARLLGVLIDASAAARR